LAEDRTESGTGSKNSLSQEIKNVIVIPNNSMFNLVFIVLLFFIKILCLNLMRPY